MEINDHSWVHIQIVTNIALKLLRQLTKHHVEIGVVRDYGYTPDDAEVVVTLAALMHCVGMSVHRHGHEDFSLFLSEPKLRELLDGLYGEPEAGPFFYELIERRGDQGFGAGNFRALFESIERQQRVDRGIHSRVS